MPQVTLTVNGKTQHGRGRGPHAAGRVSAREARLTGTHVGCDTSQCGACVVHVDGKAVKSCTMLAVQADGAQVTTIEGLAKPDGKLHPMQEAFREHHGLQCGFCTPGHGHVAPSTWCSASTRRPRPRSEIREGLEGNLCRCTGYHNIVKAIAAARAAMLTAKRSRRIGAQGSDANAPSRDIGAARPTRKEDKRFLTGKGRYTDDINRPGQAYAVFRALARTPHAKINGDRHRRGARRCPAWSRVFTGEDMPATRSAA